MLSQPHNRTGPFAHLWEAETRYAQLLLLNVSNALPDNAVCDGLQAFAAQHRATAPRRAPVHKLVLKSAAHRSSAGFLRREGRLGSLANTTSIFHMTHIAKTGGRSVKLELNRLVRGKHSSRTFRRPLLAVAHSSWGVACTSEPMLSFPRRSSPSAARSSATRHSCTRHV